MKIINNISKPLAVILLWVEKQMIQDLISLSSESRREIRSETVSRRRG